MADRRKKKRKKEDAMIVAPQTLFRDIAKGDQSVVYRHTLQMGDYKLRVAIKSDAYKNQIHAIVSVWSATTLTWSEIDRIQPGLMHTEINLYVRQDADDPSQFAWDEAELIKRAEAMLL